MKKIMVYHNNRGVEGVITEDQTGLKDYEVRVDVGERGERILHYGPVLIVHKHNIKEIDETVVCHACGESVTPIEKSVCVMRHQDPYVSGFHLSKKTKVCPKCGERYI